MFSGASSSATRQHHRSRVSGRLRPRRHGTWPGSLLSRQPRHPHDGSQKGMMRELVGYVDGLSNLCDSEQRIRAAIAAGRERPVPAWQHHLGANFGGEALGRVGASPRPRWPCQPPEADGLVRTCRTAATSGCWSSSTPGSPRRVGRGSGPPCPTGWPWSSHRAATPSWSASCTPTTRPRAAQPLAAGRP
jgi:hypothetical protein